MSDRSSLRLAVLGVLLFSLLITLVSRLFFLQVVSADVYTAKADANGTREVVTPATRRPRPRPEGAPRSRCRCSWARRTRTC